MNYRKAISFQNFMALSAEERKEHSNYFHTNYPDYCPVVLNIEHGGKKVPLKMCKFLIRNNCPMAQEHQIMRSFIIRHSQGIITSKDLITFWYNKRLIDPKMVVKEFLLKNYKDTQSDGWLHIKVTTQQAYG